MWDHPNPIFLDYETQSECDIKETGGLVYSQHPSTRVLILSICVDDVFHVWIPDYIKVDTRSWVPAMLWPHQMKPARTVKLHRGTGEDFLKAIEFDSIKSRPFVAHNAYGFDRYIWNRFQKHTVAWLDTLLLAKTAGRNGRLDALGKSLLGQGKDHAKKLMKELCIAKKSTMFNGFVYPTIKAGDLQAFTRYANGDVEILRKLWNEFADVAVEADVIEVHDKINQRGVACDRELLDIVERLSSYSTSRAVDDIEKLTRGKLNANNLRSTVQVHEWLDSFGIKIVDDKGKPCLRKEVVQRYIDSPYLIEEHLSAATEIPPVVIDVLKLRLKALRITEAKVKKAKSRVCADGRIRDLFSYHQAHTGRWSSSGVQIHNLPRPFGGISEYVEQLLAEKWNGVPYVLPLDRTEKDIAKVFDSIKPHIPQLGDSLLTVDDVSSGLLRPSFMGAETRDSKGKLLKRKVLCLVDYAQVEARLAAWIAEETKMLDAFRNGRDLYREFAAVMFGVPLDQVTKAHRQIAKSAILGCQYGLGADKFRVYAANNGADLAKAGVTAEYVINTYRDTYTKIAGFKPDKQQSFRTNGIWHKLDRAVKDAVTQRIETQAGKCRFLMREKDLLCILPSGRALTYPNARMEDVIPPYCYTLNLPLIPKATIVYESPHGIKSLYGGLTTENICQAIGRDLLACAAIQLDAENYDIVLHVHDELGCESEEERAKHTLRRMVEVMSTPPDWAEGFPVYCEGFINPRFAKSPWKGFSKFETKELAL